MGKPKLDRFDGMLRDWQKLLPQFRDRFSRSNCPLTAQAVWNYFETGTVVASPALLQGSTTMVECGDPVPSKHPRSVPCSSPRGTALTQW